MGSFINQIGVVFATIGIGLYQFLLRPHLTGRCRFNPSCSHYALAMFKQYGFLKGWQLTAERLAQCHPWGKST